MPECSPHVLSRRCWLRVALAAGGLGLASARGATQPPAVTTSPSRDASAGWLDPPGQPGASAQHALRLLADAGSDGLVPEDYGAAALAERALRLPGDSGGPLLASAFEHDLGVAMQRFLRDLHLGRVEPRTLGFRVARAAGAGSEEPDFSLLLRSAITEQRLPQLVADLRPRLRQYGKLREALARYRALAAAGLTGRLPMQVPVKPGDLYGGAGALQALLIGLGDLPVDAPPAGDRYDTTLAEGVGRFQVRHGLTADGVIGRGTLAALNVPLERRVQQLEQALERLRWLPADLGEKAFIGINIPLFRLWAWDPTMPDRTPVSMAVVVGRALNTQTPVVAEDLRYLIFQPYWNVPRSILRNELLPALRRDPGYLQRTDMEIVRGQSDDAQPVAATAENLALLEQGQLRLRQRPGPKNSLGRVKFIFPNDENVYLHDTPARSLFGRARRDFSHGCVRLEDPAALAQWVLRDQPDWTRERIEAAMEGKTSMRVDLARPLPVVLFYMTAMVMPSDPALHFADDIYGHDARLARALKSRPPIR
jgi:murein L,D-transpeptidase YcbB/YkuD